MHLPADIHTHNTDTRRDALINIEAAPGIVIPPQGLYSVGVHPWNAGAPDIDARLQLVDTLACDERVLAIGEAGIDRLRGPATEVQLPVFERQALIARDRDMPLIIHCVRAIDDIIALKKKLRPASPWIIHAFRGGPGQARQLLSLGFMLSFGAHHNPAALAITPHPLFETD